MAQHKKQKGHPHESPLKYILRGRARSLPLHASWINADWNESGLAHILVARRHVTGNITAGLYLVDLLCAGVKDTFYVFNIPFSEFETLLKRHEEDLPEGITTAEYNLVHNIIFEAIEFAQEHGIDPDPDFRTTRMILEEDDEKIPLMDIEVGDNGKPHLLYYEDDDKSRKYLAILERNLDPDEYFVTFDRLREEEDDFLMDTVHPADLSRDEWGVIIEGQEHGVETAPLAPELYIFHTVIFEPELAARQLTATGQMLTQELTITREPRTTGYTQEELEEMEDLHVMLHGDLSPEEWDNLITRIQHDIKRWPKNPILYNYLYSAHTEAQNTEEANRIVKETYERFPNYLTGKITYAIFLMQSGEVDAIPELFNHAYNLKDLYPNTSEFHIQEFALFNYMWVKYFIHKEDLVQATLHWNLAEDVDPPESALGGDVALLLMAHQVSATKNLLEEVRNDPKKREELLDQLTA